MAFQDETSARSLAQTFPEHLNKCEQDFGYANEVSQDTFSSAQNEIGLLSSGRAEVFSSRLVRNWQAPDVYKSQVDTFALRQGRYVVVVAIYDNTDVNSSTWHISAANERELLHFLELVAADQATYR